ncbi:MAG: hypothetical protein WBM40_24810, partial [Thiohalocapsa sp.]
APPLPNASRAKKIPALGRENQGNPPGDPNQFPKDRCGLIFSASPTEHHPCQMLPEQKKSRRSAGKIRGKTKPKNAPEVIPDAILLVQS